MSWPVYSERFVSSSTPGIWIGWYVPPGYRAIVRSINAVNNSANPSTFAVYIAETAAWVRSVPGLETATPAGLHLVAYAGERVQCFCAVAGQTVSVHGFLLSAGGQLASAGKPEGEPVPPPADWELVER